MAQKLLFYYYHHHHQYIYKLSNWYVVVALQPATVCVLSNCIWLSDTL